jgi:hypothetical protein
MTSEASPTTDAIALPTKAASLRVGMTTVIEVGAGSTGEHLSADGRTF